MEIPKAVLDLANELVENYGCNFQHLGIYEEREVYKFLFPTGERTGFPFVYLFDKQEDVAEELTGMKALKFLRILNQYYQKI